MNLENVEALTSYYNDQLLVRECMQAHMSPFMGIFWLLTMNWDNTLANRINVALLTKGFLSQQILSVIYSSVIVGRASWATAGKWTRFEH